MSAPESIECLSHVADGTDRRMCGVEAAETEESDAQGRGSARDRTVGVAQYVTG